jgi:hypothetical protein
MRNGLEAANGGSPRWRVHFTLTPKGGVGKSFISLCVAQREMARGRPIRCFDADAATPTLCEFAALGATRIDMMPNGASTIDASQFDTFAEVALTEPCDVLLDSGASSYVELTHYMLENDVFEQIHAAGKEAVVHSIVVGDGASMHTTLNSLNDLAEQLPGFVTLIVWTNEYFGPIRAEGKRFEEMNVYQRHQRRISGIVHLPERTKATFGEDVRRMVAGRQSFAEAETSPAFTIMARSRLHRVRSDIRQQLDVVLP